jgi:hypothetical protein
MLWVWNGSGNATKKAKHGNDKYKERKTIVWVRHGRIHAGYNIYS